jgi:hypothetical protein
MKEFSVQFVQESSAHTSLLLALPLLLLLLDIASGSDTVSAACTGTMNLSILFVVVRSRRRQCNAGQHM